MAVDITSSGSEIIKSKLHIEKYETTIEKQFLFEEFGVDETWTWIKGNKFCRVALQFPEELFHISPIICLELQQRADDEVSFAVSAEKKYGSCCVDEIGAQHFDADCIIHYGMACLSPHPRLPVKYIFMKKSFDLEDFVEQINLINNNSVDDEKDLVIVYDMAYHYKRDELINVLTSSGIKFYCPEIMTPSPSDSLTPPGIPFQPMSEDEQFVLGRRFTKDIRTSRFVYIGDNDNFLNVLMMIFNEATFHLYSTPHKSIQENISRSSKMLMKRYFMMEKARDSQFIGILVGTLDVTKYVDVIERIKSAVRSAGKKCRVYSPGTLNPAKLANLPEFDAYVLVACPLNTLIDSSDYYRPVVTPYEMILACSPEFKWSTDYKISFEQVLSEPIDEERSEVVMDVSLLTGKVRKIGIEFDEAVNVDGTVVKSCSSALMKSSDFLHSRTWQGLQPRLGETEVTKFIKGSHGTASGYSHEPSQASPSVRLSTTNEKNFSVL